MEIRVDCHVHSENSFDSDMSPETIAAACVKKGIDAVFICDHDVASESRAVSGVLFLGGIEISTDQGHLLGLGIESDVEPVRDFKKAAAAIDAAGGVAVLAHPFQKTDVPAVERSRALRELAPYLRGIEAFNARAEKKRGDANDLAYRLAKELGLITTAGSDAHTAAEVGAAYLTVEAETLSAEAVKAALLRGEGTFSGVISPRRAIAASQKIKAKKKGLPPRFRLRRALFALKCAAADLIYQRRDKSHACHRKAR
ncbi:MAG: PHP domain-containing protein [Bacillota bacterium]|jgi:predicted metal-dependent phosphoesterase TrpH